MSSKQNETGNHTCSSGLDKELMYTLANCYKNAILYFANSIVKQFSIHFDWNNIFTAILTNGGIGKGIDDTRKGIKENDIYDM